MTAEPSVLDRVREWLRGDAASENNKALLLAIEAKIVALQESKDAGWAIAKARLEEIDRRDATIAELRKLCQEVADHEASRYEHAQSLPAEMQGRLRVAAGGKAT